MKTPFAAFLSLAVLLASTTGQDRGRDKGKGQKLPLQGRELPEVTAFDENGEEFPLRQKLKGRHGVIVFGCLT